MLALRGPVMALMVLAALAGCAGDAPRDEVLPDIPGEALGVPLVAGVTSIVDAQTQGGEPMLGVAGSTLFTYSELPSGVERVYRSDDDGRTWRQLGAALVEPVQSIDADMVVDADGTIWFDTQATGCNYVAVSQDLGETWSSHPAVCLGPSRDRPRIVPTEGGTAYLYHTSGKNHVALKTTDHGLTWLPTGPIGALADAEEGHMWGGGGFWNRATGSTFFTFSLAVGPPSPILGDITYSPGFAVTRDGGLTFEVGRVPGVAWGLDQMIGVGLTDGVADAAGNVYLTWAEMLDGSAVVRMSSSQDDGRTWSEPVRVDSTPGAKLFPTITATGPGQVAVAYYEADAPGAPEAVPDDAGWNVTLAWTSDALSPAPDLQHGRLSDAPHHIGPLCPDGLECGLGADSRDLLDFFDLQPLPDGRVAAVWASTAQATSTSAVNVYGSTAEPILRIR